MAKRKKAFGTGTVQNTAAQTKETPDDAPSRWTEAIKESASTHQGIESINAKMVPVGQIQLDQNNPRELYWNPQNIADLLRAYPITSDLLEDEDQIEAYLAALPAQHSKSDRAHEELRSLLHFAGSIGAVDRLINPITGYMDGMTVQVIAGERRFIACLLLGASHAPVRILKTKPSEYDLVLLQWSENEEREDLSLFEQIGNLRRIVQAWKSETGKDLSVRELAVRTGLGKSQSQVYLKVIKEATKPLLARIERGEITSIKEAAKLVSAPPPAKKVRKDKPVGSMRVSKDTDVKAARFVVEAAMEKFSDANLTSAIKKLDLKQVSGINQALKLILGAISNVE